MEALAHSAMSYLKQDMNWTALLICQHIQKAESDFSKFVTVRALCSLGYYIKAKQIVDEQLGLLKYKEIRLLYIKAGGMPKESIDPLVSICEYSESKENNTCVVNQTSLELFFKASAKRERIRKEFLLQAFETDTMNVEALIFLFSESHCNIKQIIGLVLKIPHEGMREIMIELVTANEVKERLICPLLLFSCSSELYFTKEKQEREMNAFVSVNYPSKQQISHDELFSIAARNIDALANSEFVYHAMGVYYLIKHRYKEAVRCLYKAIEINKNFGEGFLLAGIAHSKLRETETAIVFLNNANTMMASSFLPSYCLGCEFQVMNNIQISKYHYTNAIKCSIMEEENKNTENNKDGDGKENVDENSFYLNAENRIESEVVYNVKGTGENIEMKKKQKVSVPAHLSAYLKRVQISNSIYSESIANSYIYSLIYNELYDEALVLLEQHGLNNVLRVFCHLFVGDLEQAKTQLDKCRKDSNYFVTRGFLMHIAEDFGNAIESYEESLLKGKNKVVESLLLMAEENALNLKENKAFEYANCLFESLGFNDLVV